MDPPTITANTTGADFKLVTRTKVFDDAELHCNDFCGHLAAYTSQEEQSEVEVAYTNMVGGSSSCCCFCQEHAAATVCSVVHLQPTT